ncbi:MAG: hypothetical protein A2Y74_01520 [Actinobacteria bacterium RBG_13_63_9]|nr:MAG: hypothetical protein A2Y74_01520 [Actinobacteria bacterium RBG_13_63_9]
MATDLPDYTKKIAITVTVDQEQVPETAATETPITQLGRYTGTAVTYQTVASWTVTSTKSGALREIAVESSSYTKTYFKVTIGGITQFEDKITQGPLSLPYPDVKLAGAAVVAVLAKSTDGTSVTVDATITGKEVG